MKYVICPTYDGYMRQKGFSLVELIIVVVIIGILATVVMNQIGLLPREKSRDAVKKDDINKIADAYDISAVDGVSYRPIGAKAPIPPEGGSYQGLLTADAEGYMVCATLEKGKDINCLENSTNPNCYCRSSHNDNGSGNLGYNNGGGNGNGGGNPTPSPTPVACNAAKPAGLTTNYPGGSTNSIVGTDGTWCRDLDAGSGNTTMVQKGTCEDSCGVHEDYCQSSTTNRDWYCSGTWNGNSWTNAHCEAGGYVCNSGYACSDGACRSTEVPNPFGQAIVFDGKVAGKNPPSYTPIPEYVKSSYTTAMNLPSNNVTVEAWIKPNVPTAAGYHYRIVDNTYRLTMDARPNGSNVSYLYYFDVQSSQNGCGQTVVYSAGGNGYDPNNLNWFNESHYQTVSPSNFTQWRHIAGVLQNGNLHIYENGVKLNSYNIGMSVCNDSRNMHIGAGLFGKSTPYYDYFQGAIDEVRISDIARYTSNFTVPKLPFTPDANTDMLFHFDGNTTDSSSNGLSGSTTGTVEFVNSTVPTN